MLPRPNTHTHTATAAATIIYLAPNLCCLFGVGLRCVGVFACRHKLISGYPGWKPDWDGWIQPPSDDAADGGWLASRRGARVAVVWPMGWGRSAIVLCACCVLPSSTRVALLVCP